MSRVLFALAAVDALLGGGFAQADAARVSDGLDALQEACWKVDVGPAWEFHRALQELASHDAPGVDAVCDEHGNTLMHLAAASGHAPKIAMLIAAGAAPDRANGWGNLPLHLAAQAGHADAAEALCEAMPKTYSSNGGPLRGDFLVDDIDYPNADGKTPLDLASEGNHEGVFMIVYEHGGQWSMLGEATAESMQAELQHIARHVEEKDVCSICLAADADGLVAAWCGYLFHQDCLHQHLKIKQECPICRFKWDVEGSPLV